MAEVKSGSFNTSGYSDPGWPDYYVFAWTLKSQSITDNTSTISWTLKGAGADNDARYTVVSEKYVTVNGTTKKSSASQTTYNGTVAFSGETVIKHGNDGKCRFSASAGGAFYYSGSYNSEGSGEWDLPAIARASEFTLSDSVVNLDESITITVKPSNSGFKHQVVCTMSGNEQALAGVSPSTISAATTFTFTPDSGIYGLLLSTVDSSDFIITVYTVDANNTVVGSVSKTVTVVVPDYVPEVTLKPRYENTLNDNVVQNKSSVEIDIDFKTYYGATLKSKNAVFEGMVYQNIPFTSVVKMAGTSYVKINAYDSRGRGGSWTFPLGQVYEYTPPRITEFTLSRMANGTTVIARVKGSISPVNGANTKNVSVTLNGVTLSDQFASYAVDSAFTFDNVPTDSTLTATAILEDSYTGDSPAKKNAVLPTVAVTMDFHHSGKGVAFGKVAERENELDVAWDIRYKDAVISDFVVEQGEKDFWTYRKWNSGKAEAWGRIQKGSVLLRNNFTTGVYSNEEDREKSVSLPSGLFVDAPIAFPSVNGNGYAISQVAATTKDAITYRIWAPYSVTISDCNISLYAIGKWK